MVSFGYWADALSSEWVSTMGDLCRSPFCLFVAKASLGPMAAVQTNSCEAGRSTAASRASESAGRYMDTCTEFQTRQGQTTARSTQCQAELDELSQDTIQFLTTLSKCSLCFFIKNAKGTLPAKHSATPHPSPLPLPRHT